jgi:Uma2 family endonuclease
VSNPAGRLATYDDLLTLSQDVRAEVIAGQVVTQPAPLPRHSRPQRSLSRFIGGPYDDDDGRGGPGGWWILAEVDVRFGPHDVVRPDLSGWRRNRLPAPGTMRPIDIVPDWICEVISPSTASYDRVTKRALYSTHGVAFYWLLDPDARTLEALELRAGEWLERGAFDDSSNARIPPFTEIELEVGRLFLPREADGEPAR